MLATSRIFAVFHLIALQSKMTFVCFYISSLFSGAYFLQLKEWSIPSKMMEGMTATFTCLLDPNDLPLNTLKWYKDNVELCKFQKGNDGSFNISHRLKFQKIECGNSSLSFGPISKADSGLYTCEISTEVGPKRTVQTVVGSRNLTVFAYPMEQPVIEGLKPYYQEGELIEASCTAPPSYPAPQMTWTLNGNPVDPHKTHMSITQNDGLLIATINLKIASNLLFALQPGNSLILTCTSTVMDTPPRTVEAKTYIAELAPSEFSNVTKIARSRIKHIALWSPVLVWCGFQF